MKRIGGVAGDQEEVGRAFRRPELCTTGPAGRTSRSGADRIPSGMSVRDGHIAAIDGLRGVAVGLVLLFHSGVFGAGWVGVWIFFVISGFVIAGARIGETASSLSFRERFFDFLSRRAFRILPLYVLIMLLGAVVTAITGELGDQYGLQLASLATFTFNFLRMWSEYTHSFWSGHLWSLSTEQQFYLLFPVVFFLTPRRWLPAVLIGVVLLSPLVRGVVSEIYSEVIPLPVRNRRPGVPGAGGLSVSSGSFRRLRHGRAACTLARPDRPDARGVHRPLPRDRPTVGSLLLVHGTLRPLRQPAAGAPCQRLWRRR